MQGECKGKGGGAQLRNAEWWSRARSSTSMWESERASDGGCETDKEVVEMAAGRDPGVTMNE